MIANLSCPENISKLYVDKQDTGGKSFWVSSSKTSVWIIMNTLD